MGSRLAQYLSLSLISAVSILGVVVLQVPALQELSGQNEGLSEAEYSSQAQREQVQLSLLDKVPVFGFDNLFASWMFLQFAQYFGDEPARVATGFRLSPEYFDIILDRDPRFLQAYFFMSGAVSLYAGMPDQSVEIMNEYLPELSPTVPNNAYYAWRYKAIDELLFLGDTDAAKASFLMTSKWASVYDDSMSQYVAESARQTAQFLESNPDSRSARIASWLMVYQNAFDEATQQFAIQQIEALGATLAVNNEGQVTIQLPEELKNQ